MARRSEHVERLKGVELFSKLSKSELSRLAAVSTERSFPAGEAIIEQGDAGREAYVLLEGTCTVRRGNRKVATLDPGAPFGELSLLDHGPRSAYVVADGDVVVLEIGAREFGQLLEEVPALSKKLLAALAGLVRELDRRAYG